MRTKNTFVKFMRLVVMAAIPLLLCSCASSLRTKHVEEYGFSSDMLPLIEGKWSNATKPLYSWRNRNPTLWEKLTRIETASDNAVVMLEMPDKRTLTATLFENGVETDSRTIPFKRRASWLELPTQHIPHPFLWYIVWGWQTGDPALAITANGDLWSQTVYSGVLMVTILPVFAHGDGDGLAYLYERVE